MNKKELVFSPDLAAPLFKTLRRQYNVFLLSLIAYTLLFSYKLIALPAVSETVAIQFQSISVLSTLAVIPFSLWYFGKQVPKMIALTTWSEKEKVYKKNSLYRISLLWLVIVLNVSFYFLATSYSFLLCAGMGVTASLFCIPSLKKIQCDLFAPTEEEEEENPDEVQE